MYVFREVHLGGINMQVYMCVHIYTSENPKKVCKVLCREWGNSESTGLGRCSQNVFYKKHPRSLLSPVRGGLLHAGALATMRPPYQPRSYLRSMRSDVNVQDSREGGLREMLWPQGSGSPQEQPRTHKARPFLGRKSSLLQVSDGLPFLVLEAPSAS